MELIGGDDVLFEGLVDIFVFGFEVLVSLCLGDEDEHSQLDLSQHECFLEVCEFFLYLLHYLVPSAGFYFLLHQGLCHSGYLLVYLLCQLFPRLLARLLFL